MRLGEALLTGATAIVVLGLYGIFGGTVGTHIAADRLVLTHPIAGFYATTGCVAEGQVSTEYVENPRDIMTTSNRPIRAEPLVDIMTYDLAVSERDLDGKRLRPDPKCDGFYTYKPLWRYLIGW